MPIALRSALIIGAVVSLAPAVYAQPGPGPGALSAGEFTLDVTGELRPSVYVEDAWSGFSGSPAGGTHIGAVLVRAPLPAKYGSHANSTRRPIGGGDLYGDWVPPPPEGFVNTFAQLQAALDNHTTMVLAAIAQNAPMPRRTIFVAGNAEIEVGAATLSIPPGVTLASSRGRDGSQGGLIKSSIDTPGKSFVVLSRASLGTTRPLPPVRITGLRFQGPNPHEDAPDLWDCSSNGRAAIYAFEEGHRDDPANIINRVIEIDNNEFGAWPAVAIEIAGIRGGYVHH